MRYGIKEESLRAIIGVFVNYREVQQAILYGSRAKGNYRNGSDIDLLLVGEAIDLTLLFKIQNELEDLMLPYKIDLNVKHHLHNPDLLEHIERLGQLLYQQA